MALPSLTKTWNFLVNALIPATGSSLNDNRTLLKSIKDALKGSGTWTDSAGANLGGAPAGAWTTRYWWDSVTAGTAGDGVDRWGAIGNLVWANAGSAHSWYALRQTGIATNFEVLFSCENANGN